MISKRPSTVLTGMSSGSFCITMVNIEFHRSSQVDPGPLRTLILSSHSHSRKLSQSFEMSTEVRKSCLLYLGDLSYGCRLDHERGGR